MLPAGDTGGRGGAQADAKTFVAAAAEEARLCKTFAFSLTAAAAAELGQRRASGPTAPAATAKPALAVSGGAGAAAQAGDKGKRAAGREGGAGADASFWTPEMMQAWPSRAISSPASAWARLRAAAPRADRRAPRRRACSRAYSCA